MNKTVFQSGRKYNLKSDPKLTKAMYAFLIDSQGSIFVSPAIYSLTESDPLLLKKNLKVLKMPKQKVVSSNGEESIVDKYESLESWITDLQKNGTKVFRE